jgi:hypothetical protein
MAKMAKYLLLFLVVVLSVYSLLMVKPAYAQSIPTPYKPQFSVTFTSVWYDSTTFADNRTLIFTIRNQPFTTYKDSNGNEIGLYYNFRVKEHSGDQWYYYPFGPNGTTSWLYGILDRDILSGPFFNSSKSENTTVNVNFYSFFNRYTVSSNSQLDVQVQAQIGQIILDYTGLKAGSGYNFTGSSSDWSNTHTIALTEGSTSTDISSSPYVTPSTKPAPTPTVPEFSWLTILPLLLTIPIVLGIIRKTARNGKFSVNAVRFDATDLALDALIVDNIFN